LDPEEREFQVKIAKYTTTMQTCVNGIFAFSAAILAIVGVSWPIALSYLYLAMPIMMFDAVLCIICIFVLYFLVVRYHENMDKLENLKHIPPLPQHNICRGPFVIKQKTQSP